MHRYTTSPRQSYNTHTQTNHITTLSSTAEDSASAFERGSESESAGDEKGNNSALSTNKSKEIVRPDWLPEFVPTWVCTRLHPVAQVSMYVYV